MNKTKQFSDALHASHQRIEMELKGVRSHFFQLEREIADACFFATRLMQETTKSRARTSKKRGSTSARKGQA